MKKLRNSDTKSPFAACDAMIKGEKYRFTILTSRLIRIEYDAQGEFLDSATYMVQNRRFPVPEFSVRKRGTILEIETEHVYLRYDTALPFMQESLQVRYTGENFAVYAGKFLPEWRYGVLPAENLKGTVIALDGVNGACELPDGLMSTGEVAVIDDSKSDILDENGQFIERKWKEQVDQYLFCYGCSGSQKYDYAGALRDYYQLTGKPPLLPRYALGNWWCRYYAYTQEEYTALMKRFKQEDIPFSVAVLDMDWHYVKINPKYGRGWTGYTWNKHLFPDHRGLLDFLHKEGLHVCLNLHPQNGVAPHEEFYARMADAMGVEKEEIIAFDITDETFVKNYFEILHHPLEEEGVDFWWIDYNTKIRDLDPDPLPLINHYHYADKARKDRGLILSRYAGPGSHRYPIGFSGDVVSSWESLKFQPYFTATSANIGYGWWSHDIGGFQQGVKDDELITRWVQFGVFSPICRLHSSNLRYMSKEPWRYNRICEAIMKKFLRLRHELIPYTYSMNYRHSQGNFPLVYPLYYTWQSPEAFENTQEYCFGSELIVSPIVQPIDCISGMGDAKVYLPEGIWFDFFSGRKYLGGQVFTACRDLEHMPVFAKAGGIVPMAKLETGDNSVQNPKNLYVKIFAGSDGSFRMYEDDGISYAYEKGGFSITDFTWEWAGQPRFVISAGSSDSPLAPPGRNYELEFTGVTDCTVKVSDHQGARKFTSNYGNGRLTVTVENVTGELVVILGDNRMQEPDAKVWLDEFLEQAAIEYTLKEKLYHKLSQDISVKKKLNFLMSEVQNHEVRQALLEIISQSETGS